jgi:hypothetical protein
LEGYYASGEEILRGKEFARLSVLQLKAKVPYGHVITNSSQVSELYPTGKRPNFQANKDDKISQIISTFDQIGES